jgi:hypothetical protein
MVKHMKLAHLKFAKYNSTLSILHLYAIVNTNFHLIIKLRPFGLCARTEQNSTRYGKHSY